MICCIPSSTVAAFCGACCFLLLLKDFLCLYVSNYFLCHCSKSLLIVCLCIKHTYDVRHLQTKIGKKTEITKECIAAIESLVFITWQKIYEWNIVKNWKKTCSIARDKVKQHEWCMFIKYFRPSCILTEQMLPFGRWWHGVTTVYERQYSKKKTAHTRSALHSVWIRWIFSMHKHYAITNASDDLTSVTNETQFNKSKRQYKKLPEMCRRGKELRKIENFGICILYIRTHTQTH